MLPAAGMLRGVYMLMVGGGGSEGSWDDVMRVIGQAHFMLHKKGIVRIQSDIRVGSRYVLML